MFIFRFLEEFETSVEVAAGLCLKWKKLFE